VGDSQRFRSAVLGLQEGAVILFLLHRGIFRSLVGGDRSAAELADEFALHEGRLRRILDLAMGLGFLKREGQQYGLVDGDAAHFDDLDFERSILWGGYDGMLATLLDLPNIVAGGPHRDIAGTGATAATQDQRDESLRYLHSRSGASAEAFVDALGPTPIHRSLDVGCGLGTYSAALARRFPELCGTLVDRENARGAIEAFLLEEGLADRLRFDGGDLTTMDLPPKLDVVVVSNLVHNLGEPRSRALLERVRLQLAPGGRVAVKDVAVDAERTGPLGALRFGVTMATATLDGDVFPACEVRGWMEDAGYDVQETIDLGGSYLLVGTDAG
jgi:SAM-dependent methyltransferase